MNKIVFATNNKHKLEEIRSILGDDFEVLSLSDIGCHEDIPETSDTLEGNAMQKAQYVFDKYGYDCFADDTGLEVDALGGEPGIYSARYAALDGDDSISHDSEANMAKLLRKLEGVENRKARFRTVIALITTKDNSPSLIGREGVGLLLFEGIVNGSIIRERRGGEGFGYDPIFQPEGYDQTFAELGSEIKNHISHRARAVEKLAHYLKEK
jgi:XTP/dITP diphosphohydrolase